MALFYVGVEFFNLDRTIMILYMLEAHVGRMGIRNPSDEKLYRINSYLRRHNVK